MSTFISDDVDAAYDLGLRDYSVPLTEAKSFESFPGSRMKLSLDELNLDYQADPEITEFQSTTSPSIWKRYIDELSGFAYIINEISGESKWENDDLFDLSMSVDAAVRPLAIHETHRENSWVEVIDEDGNMYYFNEATDESRWELPSGQRLFDSTSSFLPNDAIDSDPSDSGKDLQIKIQRKGDLADIKEHSQHEILPTDKEISSPSTNSKISTDLSCQPAPALQNEIIDYGTNARIDRNYIARSTMNEHTANTNQRIKCAVSDSETFRNNLSNVDESLTALSDNQPLPFFNVASKNNLEGGKSDSGDDMELDEEEGIGHNSNVRRAKNEDNVDMKRIEMKQKNAVEYAISSSNVNLLDNENVLQRSLMFRSRMNFLSHNSPNVLQISSEKSPQSNVKNQKMESKSEKKRTNNVDTDNDSAHQGPNMSHYRGDYSSESKVYTNYKNTTFLSSSDDSDSDSNDEICRMLSEKIKKCASENVYKSSSNVLKSERKETEEEFTQDILGLESPRKNSLGKLSDNIQFFSPIKKRVTKDPHDKDPIKNGPEISVENYYSVAKNDFNESSFLNSLGILESGSNTTFVDPKIPELSPKSPQNKIRINRNKGAENLAQDNHGKDFNSKIQYIEKDEEKDFFLKYSPPENMDQKVLDEILDRAFRAPPMTAKESRLKKRKEDAVALVERLRLLSTSLSASTTSARSTYAYGSNQTSQRLSSAHTTHSQPHTATSDPLGPTSAFFDPQTFTNPGVSPQVGVGRPPSPSPNSGPGPGSRRSSLSPPSSSLFSTSGFPLSTPLNFAPFIFLPSGADSPQGFPPQISPTQSLRMSSTRSPGTTLSFSQFSGISADDHRSVREKNAAEDQNNNEKKVRAVRYLKHQMIAQNSQGRDLILQMNAVIAERGESWIEKEMNRRYILEAAVMLRAQLSMPRTPSEHISHPHMTPFSSSPMSSHYTDLIPPNASNINIKKSGITGVHDPSLETNQRDRILGFAGEFFIGDEGPSAWKEMKRKRGWRMFNQITESSRFLYVQKGTGAVQTGEPFDLKTQRQIESLKAQKWAEIERHMTPNALAGLPHTVRSSQVFLDDLGGPVFYNKKRDMYSPTGHFSLEKGLHTRQHHTQLSSLKDLGTSIPDQVSGFQSEKTKMENWYKNNYDDNSCDDDEDDDDEVSSSIWRSLFPSLSSGTKPSCKTQENDLSMLFLARKNREEIVQNVFTMADSRLSSVSPKTNTENSSLDSLDHILPVRNLRPGSPFLRPSTPGFERTFSPSKSQKNGNISNTRYHDNFMPENLGSRSSPNIPGRPYSASQEKLNAKIGSKISMGMLERKLFEDSEEKLNLETVAALTSSLKFEHSLSVCEREKYSDLLISIPNTPDNPNPVLQLALWLLQKGLGIESLYVYEYALTMLHTHTRRVPPLDISLANLLSVKMKARYLGRYLGLKDLGGAIGGGDNADVLAVAASYLVDVKQERDAEHLYIGSLILNPNCSAALWGYAHMLIERGDHTLAARYLSRISETCHEYPPSRVVLAWLRELSTSTGEQGVKGSRWLSSAWCSLGHYYHVRRISGLALSCYERALECYPHNAHAHILRCLFLASQVGGLELGTLIPKQLDDGPSTTSFSIFCASFRLGLLYLGGETRWTALVSMAEGDADLAELLLKQAVKESSSSYTYTSTSFSSSFASSNIWPIIALAHFYQYVRGDVRTALNLLQRCENQKKKPYPSRSEHFSSDEKIILLKSTVKKGLSIDLDFIEKEKREQNALEEDDINFNQHFTTENEKDRISPVSELDRCRNIERAVVLASLSFCHLEAGNELQAGVACKQALQLDPECCAAHRCSTFIALRTLLLGWEVNVEDGSVLLPLGFLGPNPPLHKIKTAMQSLELQSKVHPFASSLKYGNGSPYALRCYAAYSLVCGEHTQALKLMAAAAVSGPTHALTLHSLGFMTYLFGTDISVLERTNAAIRYLSQSLSLTPLHTTVCIDTSLFLAQLHLELHNYKSAREVLQNALKASPDSPLLLASLATAVNGLNLKFAKPYGIPDDTYRAQILSLSSLEEILSWGNPEAIFFAAVHSDLLLEVKRKNILHPEKSKNGDASIAKEYSQKEVSADVFYSFGMFYVKNGTQKGLEKAKKMFTEAVRVATVKKLSTFDQLKSVTLSIDHKKSVYKSYKKFHFDDFHTQKRDKVQANDFDRDEKLENVSTAHALSVHMLGWISEMEGDLIFAEKLYTYALQINLRSDPIRFVQLVNIVRATANHTRTFIEKILTRKNHDEESLLEKKKKRRKRASNRNKLNNCGKHFVDIHGSNLVDDSEKIHHLELRILLHSRVIRLCEIQEVGMRELTEDMAVCGDQITADIFWKEKLFCSFFQCDDWSWLLKTQLISEKISLKYAVSKQQVREKEREREREREREKKSNPKEGKHNPTQNNKKNPTVSSDEIPGKIRPTNDTPSLIGMRKIEGSSSLIPISAQPDRVGKLSKNVVIQAIRKNDKNNLQKSKSDSFLSTKI